MPYFDYNRDTPDAPNNPSADQPLMEINTNSIDDWVKEDHYGFKNALGGYHQIIHQDSKGAWNPVSPTSGSPATIANINQLFVLSYTPDTTLGVADTQLFAKTGLGGVSQLTGNFAATQGYAWVGGILIQWGVEPIPNSPVNQNHKTSSVTFKDRGGTPSTIPFPNNCFVVVATLEVTSSGNLVRDANISIRSFTKTAFTWVFNGGGTGTGQFQNFTWIAIGN